MPGEVTNEWGIASIIVLDQQTGGEVGMKATPWGAAWSVRNGDLKQKRQPIDIQGEVPGGEYQQGGAAQAHVLKAAQTPDNRH